jgi:hypothetical protein
MMRTGPIPLLLKDPSSQISMYIKVQVFPYNVAYHGRPEHGEVKLSNAKDVVYRLKMYPAPTGSAACRSPKSLSHDHLHSAIVCPCFSLTM